MPPSCSLPFVQSNALHHSKQSPKPNARKRASSSSIVAMRTPYAWAVFASLSSVTVVGEGLLGVGLHQANWKRERKTSSEGRLPLSAAPPSNPVWSKLAEMRTLLLRYQLTAAPSLLATRAERAGSA
jgi:hypothetical protein